MYTLHACRMPSLYGSIYLINVRSDLENACLDVLLGRKYDINKEPPFIDLKEFDLKLKIPCKDPL